MSQVIRGSGKISMTKNLVLPDKDIEATRQSLKMEMEEILLVYGLSMGISNSSPMVLEWKKKIFLKIQSVI